MNRLLLTSFTFVLSIFISNHNLAQTTHLVTNTNNAGTGSLRQAVIDANDNDTVRLSPTLIANGTDSIVLTSEIAFSKPLVFKGVYNNTDTLFISGNNTNRIFNISNTNNIIIDSMVLINGNDINGGAISLVETDSLIILNSSICFNSATNEGGGLYVNSTAYSVTALIIENSNLNNNSSLLGGGVYIYFHDSGDGSSVIINNSNINNNSAGVGGGVFASTYNSIYGYSSTSTFSFKLNNSKVNNNSATIEDGGGIVVTFPFVVISNSIISNNYSNKKGGGIFAIPYSYISSSFLVSNSIINYNSANSSGGGIYSHLSGDTSSITTISNSTIGYNSGRSGGGIFSAYCSKFLVNNSTINDNSSIDNGGGINIDPHGGHEPLTVMVNSSTICNNSAFDGGGLYINFTYPSHFSSVTLSNSTISNNSAINQGGAVYTHHTIIDVSSSIIWTASGNGTNIMQQSGISRVNSGGYNIFSNTPNGTFNISDLTNITNSVLNLMPLANNGGETETMLPGNGSIALNSGDPIDLTDAQNKPVLGVRDIGAAENNCNEYKTDIKTTCSSFTWINGVTYTSSNYTATHTVSNATASGCDSIYSLNLTITPDTGIDTLFACDSLIWIDGLTYTSNNSSATFQLINSVGCDSIVTLNLTILNSINIDAHTACSSYTWIDGNIYTANNNTATHTLTNMLGCDSIVTLNLIINHSTTGIDIQTACDAFTWIDGITYSASNNTATHILTNSSGCDSIVTLNLTINNSITNTDSQTACGSYTWIDGITYTSNNNTATHTLTNTLGCDSLVTLNLTIENTIITDNQNGTLISNSANSYQWIDCSNDTIILNETAQTFIPSTNGDYAVIATYNTCTDTSNCTTIANVSIDEKKSNLFSLYPNPTNGSITIELNDFYNNGIIFLSDLTGKDLFKKEVKNQLKLNLETENLSKGVYIIKLQAENKLESIRLIKL